MVKPQLLHYQTKKNAKESAEEFPEVALNSIYTLAKSMQTIHLS
ncbi:hypothetical protein CU037_2674 [Enterococcus faecium]|nr:hypothetical protein [Enterococcus faecium]